MKLRLHAPHTVYKKDKMQTLQAVIMGAFQGLTEFLPVSSSGHIVLSSALYKLITGANFEIVTNEEIFFDILIHLSTLFAVIIYFFNDIKEIFKGFFKAVKSRDYKNKDFKFLIYILISTMITCIFGFLIKDYAHKLTQNPFIVSLMIMLTGVVLFLSEKFKNKENKTDFKTALFVGLAQGFAVFPGLSRSGMTISAAIFKGVKRIDAAKFSFILSIPIIILASLIYPLITFDLKEVQNFNMTAIVSGMITSFVIGYICIKFFMKFLEKSTLRGFAYYCWIFGGICALIFFIN